MSNRNANPIDPVLAHLSLSENNVKAASAVHAKAIRQNIDPIRALIAFGFCRHDATLIAGLHQQRAA